VVLDQRDHHQRHRAGGGRDHARAAAGEGDDGGDAEGGVEADLGVDAGDDRERDRLGDQRQRDHEAGAEYEQEVRKIAAPPADRARLYIFTGTMQRYAVWTAVGTIPGGASLHGITGDIYIDEVKIGTLNPKEAMVVDVIPGKHSLSWFYMGKDEWALLKRTRTEREFAGGTAHVLFANVGDWDLVVAPGIVVTATDPGPANNAIPQQFKVVRPSSCPPTICIAP
jgi:hypothetical protein